MVLFVPISAQQLSDGIRNFEEYINRDDLDVLIQTALAHLEFEALHPFKDGNGRVGRMLITLNLWAKKRISGPHFYISECLEENRDEYIDRMRRASSHDEWTDWVVFFLEAIRDQAHRNCQAAEAIYALYEEMKVRFHEALSSQWSTHALDYIFAKCVFRNSAFTKNAGIPSQSAHRITKSLADAQLLTVVVPASGRRSALYAFQPLIKLISP
jgi:Fic family protein